MKVDHQHQQMGDVPLPPVITRISSSPFLPRASERRVLLIVGVCQTFSHLHIFTSHLQILTSSHPHIFTSVHLNIFSSSHLLIFTSAHLHICSSSHLLIFTSAHLHSFTSSHPHIITSAHLHIFSSSHLLIFTSSHLHITSSHLLIFTSSHPHILTSSHPHIFTSSHLHIFTFSLALLLSCPLLFPSFPFLSEGAGQCQRDGTKRSPFARNEVGSPKTAVKLRFCHLGGNHFARNELRSPKTVQWNCDFDCAATTLSHETRFDRQKLW